jgi:hypothetical protein
LESRHIVFHIEHGHTRIDADQIKRIASALHCTIDDLHAPPEAPMPRVRFRGRPSFSAPTLVPVIYVDDFE